MGFFVKRYKKSTVKKIENFEKCNENFPFWIILSLFQKEKKILE